MIKDLIKVKEQYEQEAFLYRIQLESIMTQQEINELLESGYYE